MGLSMAQRRAIDGHAMTFAIELKAQYGDEADQVMRACLEHPGYSAAERYCFQSVRRSLRRRTPSADRRFSWANMAERLRWTPRILAWRR